MRDESSSWRIGITHAPRPLPQRPAVPAPNGPRPRGFGFTRIELLGGFYGEYAHQCHAEDSRERASGASRGGGHAAAGHHRIRRRRGNEGIADRGPDIQARQPARRYPGGDLLGRHRHHAGRGHRAARPVEARRLLSDRQGDGAGQPRSAFRAARHVRGGQGPGQPDGFPHPCAIYRDLRVRRDRRHDAVLDHQGRDRRPGRAEQPAGAGGQPKDRDQPGRRGSGFAARGTLGPGEDRRRAGQDRGRARPQARLRLR